MQLIIDPYKNYDRAYKRIKEEFEKFGELIIAVDFDDTIYNTHRNAGWCYLGVVKTLLRWQDHAKIVAWTASTEDRYDFIRSIYEAHGIRLDAINENVNGIERRGPKIYANIYLDDRTFGLDQALQALNTLADVKGF